MKRATAPYNFIPLNNKIVESDNKDATHDKFDEKKFTGHIDYKLKTLTHLYIRDTLNDDEEKEKEKHSDEKKEKFINPDFFSPGGKHKIPGSSLRGMIRSLIEIMSWAKFDSDIDKRLCYRAFVDNCDDLNDKYSKYIKSMSCGILKKNGSKYVIKPSKKINGLQYFRIEKEDVVKDTVDQSKQCFKPIWFKPVKPTYHTHAKGKISIYYGKVKDILFNESNDLSDAGYNKGYLVISGPLGNKKHMHWIVNLPDPAADSLTIPKEVIEDYKDDNARANPSRSGNHVIIDLLKEAESADGVPCFYILDDNGDVKSFGHTGMFRLAYDNKISDLCKQDGPENILDIPSAMFGVKSDNNDTNGKAGRVFFEDAPIDAGQENIYVSGKGKAFIPGILSGPEPTCFQHYLESDNGRAKHYDSVGARIRGYKLYWHQNEKIGKEIENKNVYEVGKEKDITTQNTVINPLRDGLTFTGRIRFYNLSEVELGALMFALKLWNSDEDFRDTDKPLPNFAHKIGMGKPLGLGSILINPTLTIIDAQKRYKTLFDNDSWDLGETVKENEDVNKFIKTFKSYVIKAVNCNGYDSNNRIKYLKAMLSFPPAKRPKEDDVKDMGYNNSKDRRVLPHPMEVKR